MYNLIYSTAPLVERLQDFVGTRLSYRTDERAVLPNN
jgi:hypothetical protein